LLWFAFKKFFLNLNQRCLYYTCLHCGCDLLSKSSFIDWNQPSNRNW